MERMKRVSFYPALALIALLSTAGSPPVAESWSARFDAANKLFEQGKYPQAIDGYQQLADAGATSGALYFNLGNAHYKSSELGRAIVSYRQANRRIPRDPDLQANLQFVRNQVQGPTLPPGRAQHWLSTLTLNEWTLLTSVALWLWMIPLTLIQFRAALRPALRSWILAAGITTVTLAVCLSLAWSFAAQRVAVVVAGQAVVHNGPLDESSAAFTVHDGAELNLLDQKDDWFQVTAGDRRIGWLRRNQVLVLPAT